MATTKLSMLKTAQKRASEATEKVKELEKQVAQELGELLIEAGWLDLGFTRHNTREVLRQMVRSFRDSGSKERKDVASGVSKSGQGKRTGDSNAA